MRIVIPTVIAMLIVSYIVLEVSQTIVFFKKSHDLSRSTVPYSREIENPTDRVLIVGDSMGMGAGASSSTHSIAGRLGSEYPTISIENISEPGADIEDVEGVLRENVARDFDIVIIFAGTNDMLGKKDIEEVKSQIQQTLTIANEVAGREVIFVAPQNIAYLPALPPLADLYYKKSSIKIHDELRRSVQHSGALFINIFSDKKNGQLAPYLYAQDRIHLNDDGYEFLYQKIREDMDENGVVLGESRF